MSTYCLPLEDYDQEKYNEPMVWVGIYVAIASLLCILAMATDLLHGFRNRKLWFPSKYFSLNAASITVITVAMKLPVDLSSDMPSYMDQATKLESLAFMCTMMANFMPSLAAMDNKTLLANIIDIFSACFTNIPQVITVKCHESVIEKTEVSVKVAAKLLGKTTQIIERLETCEVPSMNPDKMAYVDEWRLYLKQSTPQGF
ncbi:hypothetical protein L1987_49461 [Smallanthus sonchifolius]|uniref:Uncharacterized protein n=1 Tax=Smallanthus sonchifolius TaxID=185202 RepID=A0ACB9FVD1_9ASTR|nr:hypothetical protein L1987_49461 [Smallanthus sonchifolius]